jgi:hypothetical protein
MRRATLLFLGVVSSGGLWLAQAPSVQADRKCGGVELPERAEVSGETLQLNGVGIRRATFLNVHVYVGGLYVPRPTRVVADIMQPTVSKQLTLHFVRDVSRKDMLSAIRDGLHDNAGAQLKEVEAHVASMERYLPDLHTGTQLKLVFQPKQGLRVYANDKLVGVEKNDLFANLLFHIWLGPKPPDTDLKTALLGGPCS